MAQESRDSTSHRLDLSELTGYIENKNFSTQIITGVAYGNKQVGHHTLNQSQSETNKQKQVDKLEVKMHDSDLYGSGFLSASVGPRREHTHAEGSPFTVSRREAIGLDDLSLKHQT